MVSNVNLLGESPSHKYAHSWLHRTTNNEKLCKHIYGFINKRIIYCISFFSFLYVCICLCSFNHTNLTNQMIVFLFSCLSLM